MAFKKGHPRYGGVQKGDKHKKTIAQEKALEFIQKRIRKEIDPIMDSLIAKCKDGDMAAINTALDRLVGKPKETRKVFIGGLKDLLDEIHEEKESPIRNKNTNTQRQTTPEGIKGEDEKPQMEVKQSVLD